jgi:hypothetical protein
MDTSGATSAKQRSAKEEALRTWHKGIEDDVEKIGEDVQDSFEDGMGKTAEKAEKAPKDIEDNMKEQKRRTDQEMKKWGSDDEQNKTQRYPQDSHQDDRQGMEIDQSEERAVVSYGPRDCVSTYRSQEGHCIMKTNCRLADIRDYNFGLVCVDTDQVPVRHLFGKDSFDPQETFDTLIKCEQCLGLEDLPDNIVLNGQVVALAEEISGLRKMAQDITGNIAKLNQQVFPQDNGTYYGSGQTYSNQASQSYGQPQGGQPSGNQGSQRQPYYGNQGGQPYANQGGQTYGNQAGQAQWSQAFLQRKSRGGKAGGELELEPATAEPSGGQAVQRGAGKGGPPAAKQRVPPPSAAADAPDSADAGDDFGDGFDD